MNEAKLLDTEAGVGPASDGWFVLNTKDGVWKESREFGRYTSWEGEGEARFKELGINIGVMLPGQPACMYHGEDAQEDFLVLSGECLLIVEGEERPLQAWDFVHCPPWTKHVIVAAGSGPCIVLAVGARNGRPGLLYPADETARKYGASAERDTADGTEAYAAVSEVVRTTDVQGDLPG